MNIHRVDLKLGATIILLFLIVLLPLGFVIDQIISSFYYRQVEQDVEQLSSRYADVLSTNYNSTAIHMIELMATFSQENLYIVDDKGNIIVSTSLPMGLLNETTISEEELNTLFNRKPIKKMVEDTLSMEHYMVYGKPIIDDTEFYGGVYVFASIEEIYRSVAKVRYLLILSGVGALFLALGFTFVFSRKLSAPLLNMEKATRKIAKGNLDTRVMVSSKDEIGSLAAAINDLAKDLKRHQDTRREFFANVSHELRTPITYLEGYAKVLKEGLYQTEEEKIQYLSIIHQEAGRLTRLIHDLFELSKLEEGKVSLNLEWVDFAELLDGVILKTGLKAKEKGLELKVNIEEALPFIYSDGLRIEQILINLIDNAIRYTDHGAISVQVRMIEQQEVAIIIEDTGKGIPNHELPYIFERFYRVEKSRSREYGGTGLGLAIAKQLVEIQGGRIEVFSEVGRGTRFELFFPITVKPNIEEGEP